jgi:seryl-tRNA synthetase
MQGLIALLLGSAGGLLIWAILAQQKVSKLRSKYSPITNAEEEAERIRKQSSVLQEQSKKVADSIVAKGQADLKHLEQKAEEKAERIKNRASELQEQSKKAAASIVAKGQAKLKQLEQEAESVMQSISTLEMKRDATQNELNFINQVIALKSDDIHLLEVGYFEVGYDFEDLPAYEAALKRIREEQKQMLRMDGSDGERSAAAFCSETIRFNESVAQGRSMIKKILKLMLRAFNGECDSYIARVSYKNVSAMEKRIETSHEQINRLGESWYCSISNKYLENRIEELRLSYTYEEVKQKEKEEQAQIREQMREEEKAIREIEKAREQAEKDEAKFADMLEKAKAEAQRATDQDKEKLNEKITKLEALLAEAAANRQRAISRAQMTRSGHVYVISNVGSFGEHVYKIGMTRRLEPLDRVRELGDASVPFPFDVHALIFTDDAPYLENTLHKRFNFRRVNFENIKKEFFRVTIEEIRDELHKIHQEVGIEAELRLTLVAEAKQFRLSEAKRREFERSYSGDEPARLPPPPPPALFGQDEPLET